MYKPTLYSKERLDKMAAVIRKKWPEFGSITTPPNYEKFLSSNNNYATFQTRDYGWLPAESVAFPGLMGAVACCGIQKVHFDGKVGPPLQTLQDYQKNKWDTAMLTRYLGDVIELPQGEVNYIQGMLNAPFSGMYETLFNARIAAFHLWLGNSKTQKYAMILASTASPSKTEWSAFERILFEYDWQPLSRNVNRNYEEGHANYCTLWKLNMSPDVLYEMPEYQKLRKEGVIHIPLPQAPTPPTPVAAEPAKKVVRRITGVRKTALHRAASSARKALL